MLLEFTMGKGRNGPPATCTAVVWLCMMFLLLLPLRPCCISSDSHESSMCYFSLMLLPNPLNHLNLLILLQHKQSTEGQGGWRQNTWHAMSMSCIMILDVQPFDVQHKTHLRHISTYRSKQIDCSLDLDRGCWGKIGAIHHLLVSEWCW